MKFSSSELILKDMSPGEMREAYLTDMVHVFPPEELKPCDAIYEEMLEGKFLACGLYAGGTLVAYVFSACVPGYGYLFTQYVVVKEKYRSMGVGGHLMDALAKHYADYRSMFLDVEDPASGEEIRARRVRFYEKNGFRTTRVRSRVYGVDYIIMARDFAAQACDEEIYEAACTIYKSMARPGAYPDKFRVFLRPEERGMARKTWARIRERRFRMARVEMDGFHGMAGVLDIIDAESPRVVRSVLSEAVVIADTGYTWLQLSPDAGGWWLTVMYDERGALVQYYFDVTLRNFTAEDGEPRFVDLYLDVVMDPAGRWGLLDRDELDEARDGGHITPEEHALAISRAEDVIRMIDGREAYWRAICERCLAQIREVPE